MPYQEPDQLFIPKSSNIKTSFEQAIFEIPMYQRPYSWKNEEVEELFNDIKNSFFENNRLFIGTIYLKRDDLRISPYFQTFEIIDGQQRFTTLSLMLIILYVLMNKNNDDSSFHYDLDELKRILWKGGNIDLPLLTSGSIEKAGLKELFNLAKNDWRNYEQKLKSLDSTEDLNVIERNLYKVTIHLYKLIDELIKKDKNTIRDFIEFLLTKVLVISIFVQEEQQKVFSIFESINSKGKKLDEIDLIKTFIFSEIPSKDSERFLEYWGTLTIKTNNNLEDYLWTYIKGFIKYYAYDINLKNFKSLVKNGELNGYYNLPKNSSNYEILEALILDLMEKLNSYIAMNDIKKFQDTITADKSVLLQFNIFNFQKYKHCRPLFLRAIYEFTESTKDIKEKQKLTDIFRYSNSFMVEFQTLEGRDSKDSKNVFQEIAIQNYNNSRLTVDSVKKVITKALALAHIDYSEVREKLFNLNAYDEMIGKVMLIIAESYHEDFFSEDKANNWFNHQKLSIDHLLSQNPDSLSDSIYDRKQISNNRKNDILELRYNADFPSYIVNGMLYDDFKIKILNKLGNLQFLEHDSNSSKSNNQIESFKFYNDLEIRQKEIIDKILNSDVFYVCESEELMMLNNPETVDLSPKAINLNEPNTSINRRINAINIFGERFDVKGMNGAMQRIFNELYRCDSEKFIKLEEVGTDRKPFISRYYNELRAPKPIENSSWFIETHSDNVDNIRKIKKALNLYDIPLEQLMIFYE